MKTLRVILGGAVSLLICSTEVFAATNPSTATETSSTGSSDLSVTIPVLYRISAINDLTTANYTDNTNSVSLSMNDDVCVYTNAAAGDTYLIRMQGSSTCTGGSCPGTPSDTFAISNDTNNQFIPYTVYWNDETGTTGRAVIGSEGGSTATIASNQSGASRDWQCSAESGTNANFSVDFDREDILDVLSGAYTGTLTITLLPPT
jgi:hypothetical protein